MDSLEKIMSWTFIREIELPNKIQEILVEGEIAEVAYKTLRDVAVITNKRVIVADKQGLTGTKVDIYTIPFKSIIMYSSENSGILDLNSEIELWTKVGNFKLCLRKGIDVRALDRLIGKYVL